MYLILIGFGQAIEAPNLILLTDFISGLQLLGNQQTIHHLSGHFVTYNGGHWKGLLLK